MEQMVALLVKGFKKMVYKNFKKGRRFYKKGSSSSKYDKRNNRRSTDWKESKSGKLDKSKERCYNCDGIGHFAADCRKPKAEKKQALISKKNNWDDSLDSDDSINYALMANANTEADNAELKKIEKSTEKNKPVNIDTKFKLNKVQLKTIKFNPSADAVKSVNQVGSTSTPRSNLITDKSEQGDGNLGKILGYEKIKHNLVSVSQICDRGYHVNFYEEHCEILSKTEGKIAMTSLRHGSLYEARVSISTDESEVCLLSRASVEDSWNWHKRLSHLNCNNINELVRKDLVRGFPNAVFTPDGLCDTCQKAKQRKTSFKSKTESSILEPYHLLHIDIFGPVNVMSIAKKRYALVIVDEYTRYTWVYFLQTKDESPSILLDHVLELEKGSYIQSEYHQSDNGTEFKNSFISDDPHNSGNSLNTEAYVEGEQHDSNPETFTSDSAQGTAVDKSSNSQSSNSDESNTDNYGNTDVTPPNPGLRIWVVTYPSNHL
ncbi:hypothetical protein AgCh_025944 [Apium graveolens]